MNRPLRWGLAGTGPIAATTAPDLHLTDDLDLVVVASRTPERARLFAAEHHIPRWVAGFDELFADDGVDVVYLCTPIATHAALAIKAVQAGKHVVVEKAFATTAAEARQVAAAAATHNRFCMEAMWMRFNPAIGRIREEIAAGAIGDIHSVQAAFGFPAPPGGGIWRPEAGGGALLDLGVYPVTFAHLFLGAPDTVTASGKVRADGLDLTASMHLQYDDGRFATGQTTLLGFVGAGAAIGGSGGFIAVDPPFHAATTYRVVTPPFRAPRTETHPPEGHGYVPMFRAVTHAIRDGLLQHPDRPLTDTIAVLDTLDEVRAHLTPHHRSAP